MPEKGNESTPDTPDDNAIEDPGVITSGGGPNINATKPRPSGSLTRPDGSTRTVEYDPTGQTVTTMEYDEGGNVISGEEVYLDDLDSYASTENADGSKVESWKLPGDETRTTRTTLEDGTWVTEYDSGTSRPTTTTTDPSGSRIVQKDYFESDIITGEPVQVTETYKEGVTTKSYTDSQGSTVKTTAADGSGMYETTATDGTQATQRFGKDGFPR